jgi:putative flavoprotein involved in K+ transport
MTTAHDAHATPRTRDDNAGTIVVGAGQAGLVMARHLQAAGEPVLVLEGDDRIGDTWRRHYPSLRLFTTPKYSSLPGWRIPVPGFPTGNEMADYLEAYAQRFELPVRTGTRVISVECEGRPFRVSTDRGDVVADRVVVASGAHRRPRMPAFAAELSPHLRQLHSLEYRNAAQLVPGGVLVVGAANSGSDIALESAAAGHPTWLAGRHPGQVPIDIDSRRGRALAPVIMFAFRHVLTLRTPMGRRAHQHSLHHGVNLVRNKLADLDGAGVTRIGRIEAVHDGAPVTADGFVPDVKTVVWCTGSGPDHSFLPDEALGEDGRPRHNRGVSPIDGLYFLGLEFQYALASGTIQGLDRDARHLLTKMRTARRAARRTDSVSARGATSAFA